MLTYNQLNDIIVNSFSNIKFNKEPKNLYEPIGYILNIGGKRVRPILTLAGCNLFTDNIEQAINPAIAVEIFHNFTLVHDDIMDNASLRRGKETIHKRWNENIAILSGDAMTIVSYQHLAATKPEYLPRVLSIFNSFALGICEGQQFDMDFEKLTYVNREEYIKMIELKTAILLKGALQIGAVVGGASKDDINRIGEFGRCLGIAFQLQDDLLDSFGNTETFGKNIGGDIVANKKTILTIETLNLLENSAKLDFIKIMSDLSIENASKIKLITGIYEMVNVKEAVENLINDYNKKAQEALNSISVSNDRKNVLIDISEKLMNRIS